MSEDACLGHRKGADAVPVPDSQLGGGTPARADYVMRRKRMLAGRAKALLRAVVVGENLGNIHVGVRNGPSVGPKADHQGRANQMPAHNILGIPNTTAETAPAENFTCSADAPPPGD